MHPVSGDPRSEVEGEPGRFLVTDLIDLLIEFERVIGDEVGESDVRKWLAPFRDETSIDEADIDHALRLAEQDGIATRTTDSVGRIFWRPGRAVAADRDRAQENLRDATFLFLVARTVSDMPPEEVFVRDGEVAVAAAQAAIARLGAAIAREPKAVRAAVLLTGLLKENNNPFWPLATLLIVQFAPPEVAALAAFDLGMHLVGEKAYAQAAETLALAVDSDDEQIAVQAEIYRAYALARSGSASSAVALLRDRVGARPPANSALLDQAEEVLVQLLGEVPDEYPLLLERVGPRTGPITIRVAHLLAATGRDGQAESVCEQALGSSNPFLVSAVAPTLARIVRTYRDLPSALPALRRLRDHEV
ncbi:hypothetical protein [Actinoplanes auranticolor]|uniref:Tetratricopeptide repeat protein n=1 Tax=Actinoplanes auranticolor TaxID=47988 RepID=A0A919S7A1_9ACTN|nr:hypothetical protein [Actinoplanes auranticolor]GIM64585.1 hypothetical protein Aau02nite_11380 [Actinoplanes auranticolor]